jgi:predicted dehydrogenase
VTALLSASAAAVAGDRFDIDVLGTDGEAHFDLATKLQVHTRRFTYHPPEDVLPGQPGDQGSIFRRSFVYLARALVSALLHGDADALAAAARIQDAIPVIEVLDAIRRSAIRGTAVRLRPARLTNVGC